MHLAIIPVIVIITIVCTSPAAGLIEEFGDELTFTNDNSLKEWDAPDMIRQQFPYYQSGYDDEGRPIWVAEFGKWDIKGVFEAGDEELEKKFDRYLNKLVLNVLMSLREDKGDGKPEDILVIVDMEGYTMSQLASAPTIRYITRKIVELFAIANRRLASGYIINANFIAERFVNIMRPVLGGIMQRVEVFGTNKSVWIPRLLKQIPMEELPEWYGGKKGFKPVKVFG